MSQKISKEEVEVAIRKDSQLHLLIDTTTAKTWRELSDLAELALMAIVGDGTDVVEVGKCRRDLIPKHQCCHHLIDVTGELNPKEN